MGGLLSLFLRQVKLFVVVTRVSSLLKQHRINDGLDLCRDEIVTVIRYRQV